MMNLSIRQVLLCVLMLVAAKSYAQNSGTGYPIRLKSGNFTPVNNADQWLESRSRQGAAEQPGQVLLQFSGALSAEQKNALAANGIQLLDYIPENTYLAIITGKPTKAKMSGIPLLSITDALPEWKADEYLWHKSAIEKGSIKVLLSVYKGTSETTLRSFITSLGGQVEHGDKEAYGYYNITLPAAMLRNLAGWYAVRYISPLTDLAPLDLQSIPAVKGNTAIKAPIWGGMGLNGDSVTVGVGDNTSGIYHTDVTDRILNFNPAMVTNHGIHINCITGGAAILNPLAASMTPKVSLINFFFSNVLSATGTMFQEHNMTITNNSYTVMEGECSYFGVYDLYSRFLDTMAIQYPLVQHVFAAGNDGKINCPPYAPGYATVGGGYQPSKNVIVVGSTTHNYMQAADQSRGPVKDGRLKPDIVAVGSNVYSGLRNNTYGWASGTSMASPQVASGLAVLTQRYKQTHGGTQPRADLLKTILLNGAMDLGNAGPDYSYGFGMMDIGRSLQIMDNNRFFTGNISTGDSQTFTITIPAGTAQTKVMLCWNDVPASPSSATQLINDLDLSAATATGTIHLPLGLDGSAANALNIAIEKPDHLNNVEQVTINNPAAGTYTIKVKGFNIPFGPQHFVVIYDIIPKQLELTYPLGGESISNNDSLRIFWNAIPDGNTYNVAISYDDGANWSTLNTAVAANAHYQGVLPAGINAAKCKVRVTRNGTSEIVTSQSFTISSQPVLALASAQCPGYVNIHWSPIGGATAYEVLKKIGSAMQVVDTVSDTTYSFSGMSLIKTSIVAVQPLLNGRRGYRSLALTALANNGNCLLPASAGDLMAEKIVSPASGRLLTSTAPGASSILTVRIRSLYNSTCSNYTLSYKINSRAWQTLVNPGIVIPANGTIDIGIPGISFATPGDYAITTAITNTTLTDPQHSNDTAIHHIKCLPNDPIDLNIPFTDGFESMDKIAVSYDSIGISPNAHWDYFNDDDSGRLRSNISSDLTITGNRSISLDQFMPMHHGSNNILSGTFNLSGYDTATTEIRVDFDYLLHGNPAITSGNLVMARANDGASWQPMHQYDLTAYPGYVRNVRSLSLTDIVRKNNANFSSSTQVAFGQNDSSIIADRNYGCGMTIDNFRMYTVTNDAILAEVVSPLPNNCGLTASVPLTVKVKNGVNTTLRQIQLFYSMDGGTTYSATLDSVKAKDSVNFTFPQLLNIGTSPTHQLKIWLAADGDSYQPNDSLPKYDFRNSQIIASYPYLENFEANDGGYYADGFLSSWQYGTPASPGIHKSASGTKAWKTNLTGRYNNLERSYLYTPCFDISSLSTPMLSFSMAQDLENCGNILCDGAYLEYSFDGTVWNKLKDAGQGYNWYDSTFVIWNTIGFTRWHVATTSLPQPPSGKTMHLRFVLFADPAVSFEGLALDDIHIYENGASILPVKNTIVSNTPATGVWNSITANDALIAAIQPSKNIGNITTTLYQHDTLYNPGQTQFIMPRSYVMSSENTTTTNTKLQLYLEDKDVAAVVNDTTCPSCTPVADAYSLGLTQYSNNNKAAENGSLNDDTGGQFSYIPYNNMNWVPYKSGYRAEVNVQQLSEMWLNNGGPIADMPGGKDYLNFLAFRSGNNTQLLWQSLIDKQVSSYTVQRSDSGIHFTDLTTVNSLQTDAANYVVTDTTSFNNLPVRYYRLQWHMTNSSTSYYSPVRKISANDSARNLVQFSASMAGSWYAAVNWTSYLDGIADHYTLERAIDNSSYTLISNNTARNIYGQQYTYNDAAGNLASGTPVHYRLTARMKDGSSVVLPEQTIYWINGSSISNIYPNPTHDGSFTINWHADAGKEMQLTITDIAGKIMETGSAIATQWNNSTTFATARRPKGVYIIYMVVDGTRHTARLLYE
jgi:hypothetical protein